MSVLQAPPETMAELLASLGDLPASRVRLVPPPGQATVQDVLDLHRQTKRLYELVDGTLVEKPMAFFESRLAAVLIYMIEMYLDKQDLGIVTGESGMMRLARGLVRIPDVAFLSWGHFPNRLLPREPIPNIYPDLAIEILSPSNTAGEMARKREDYFRAGVQLVWIVDPPTRTLEAYTSPDQCQTYHEDDVVPGDPILPGFQLSIREWFNRAGVQES